MFLMTPYRTFSLRRSALVPLVILSSVIATAHAAIAPYLQSATQTSIHVCWQSASTATPVVRYGAGMISQTATGVSDQLASGVIWHDVVITGLTPGTVYTYRCVEGSDSSDVFTFATAPSPAAMSGHIRFAIISDSQEYSAQSSMVVDSMRAMVMRLWGEDLTPAIGLVVHCGDILSTGSVLSQYQSQYFSSMAPVSARVPFMVSIGNHEGESEYYYRYMRYGEFGGPQGDRYYAFRYGRLQFIALNTNGKYRNDQQIAWLDSVCAAAEGDDQVDWIFTYGHHPALSEVWPDGNTAYTETRILPTLAKYSKATLHSAGHTHAYERGALKDAPLHTLIFGGAGGALDRWRGYANQTDYAVVSRSMDHHGFALVDVDVAAGMYTFRAFSLGSQDVTGPGISLSNTLIDSYTAWKRKAKPQRPVASDMADSIDLPVALSGSPYVASRQQWSSEFQMRTATGTYTSGGGLVVDVVRDAENAYMDTGAPLFTPIDKNANIDLTRCVLTESPAIQPGTHFWRVRYRDVNLDWSEWSPEKGFVVRDPTLSTANSDRALRFDGGPGYLEVAPSLDSAVLPVKAMTVELWVRPDALPLYGGFIGAFEDNSGTQKGWVLGNVLNHLSFGLSATGADDGNGLMTYLQDPAQIVTGRWYHVAGVYDGTQMRLYVNGIQVASSGSQSGDILYDRASRFTIGAYRDANEFTPFNGTMDELRLWRTPLSTDEIRGWMFRSASATHPSYGSLISCWHFDQAMGDSIVDEMGANTAANHGLALSAGVRSTAPVGMEGACFVTQTGGNVGAAGAGVQFNPVSTLSAANMMGIYTTGRAAAPPVTTDLLPSGVGQRAHLSWGFWERGSVTASAALRYGSIVRGGDDAALRLLFRPAADTAWTDVTEDQYQDVSNAQFIVSGPMSTGLYAIGWAGTASGVENGSASTPGSMILYQNYPNPFNPSTTIRFALPYASTVKLEVFNLLGQRVATLVDGGMAAGYHEVRWNAITASQPMVASGVYFYRLEATAPTGVRFIEVKKIVLLQ
jgi:hypothetical protein